MSKYLENIRALQAEIDVAEANWEKHDTDEVVEDFTIKFNRPSSRSLPPCGCKGECFIANNPKLLPQRSCRWDR